MSRTGDREQPPRVRGEAALPFGADVRGDPRGCRDGTGLDGAGWLHPLRGERPRGPIKRESRGPTADWEAGRCDEGVSTHRTHRGKALPQGVRCEVVYVGVNP